MLTSQNNCTSDSDLDLDLPVVNKKNKTTSMRVYESSECESPNLRNLRNSSSEEGSSENSSNSSLKDSELDDFNSQATSASLLNSQNSNSFQSSQSGKKKNSKMTKKQKYLSYEIIINSDIDGFDEPDQFPNHSEGSDSDDTASNSNEDNTSESRKRSSSSKKKLKRIKKTDEFVKASGEDFKSKFQFIGNEEESEESSGYDSEDSEEADDEGFDREKKSNAKFNFNNTENETPNKSNKIKKPKESLNSVLKESESLLRRQELVELPINVLNPRPLSLVLNEALVTNSKASKDNLKLLIEQKRKIQQKKLEKLLGTERMSDLIKDNPKIGHDKLDESVEITLKIEDEKAAMGDDSFITETIKFKLVDLPDKHFDPKQKKFSDSSKPETVSGYRAYLRNQKKSSIDILNEQLRDRIAAQGDALIAQKQHARSLHLANLRAKEEARLHARKMKEVQKERELKAKREKKCDGADLFSRSKKKFEGTERRPIPEESYEFQEDNNTDDNANEYKFMKLRTQVKAKIIVSSDNEDSEADSVDASDLLNLEGSADEREELPEMNEAISTLLSGKFESETEAEAENEEFEDIQAKDKGVLLSTSKPVISGKSEFIDDEASDEDEEMEADEDGDEEAMELEMIKSKFIVKSSEEEDNVEFVDQYNTIQYINEISMKQDEENTNRLLAKYAKHMIGEKEKLVDDLNEKYGIKQSEDDTIKRDDGHFKSIKKISGIDEDIQRLLDPIEQKKRKLAALGSLNILQRQRTIEAADEEFRFKDEKRRNDAGVNDQFSSDYYASETDMESSEIDIDSDSEEAEDEMYYETVESGLQSRVEEMIDAELLDGEEVQVQASESLTAHLNAITPTGPTENINPFIINAASNTLPFMGKLKSSGVTVPSVNAKLKSRLMALQQENDENGGGKEGGGAGGNDKKGTFKGFTFKTN